MSSFILALLGALIFILAYSYYIVAGMFRFPGSEAVSLILEFGGGLLSVLLMALVLGTSASLQPQKGSERDSSTLDPSDGTSRSPR